MANNFPEYFKRFANRNLINDDSIRDNEIKKTNNFTTITDLLVLPLLSIVTLVNLLKRAFNKKNK